MLLGLTPGRTQPALLLSLTLFLPSLSLMEKLIAPVESTRTEKHRQLAAQWFGLYPT